MGGAGRKLTSSGVLLPAEAVQACQDPGIELPGLRLGSALDVGELMRDWLTAAAAGFVEIEGRRTRMAPGLPGVDSSQRPDPQSVLNAWVQAAAAVLPVDEDPCAGWCRAPDPRHRGNAIIRTA